MVALVLVAGVCPAVSATTCNWVLKSHDESIVRTGGVGYGVISLNYCLDPNAVYDLYIDDGKTSEITPPEWWKYDYLHNYTKISDGHYKMWSSQRQQGTIDFRTTIETTPKTYIFKIVDPTGNVSETSVPVQVIMTPTPTAVPLPTQTFTYGTLIIKSDPSAATVYLDSEIKGITPITIHNVPNGQYKVLLRLDGYKDKKDNNVNVAGDEQTIDLTLSPKTEPTETETPDYGSQIAALESNVSEQNASIVAVETQIAGHAVTLAAHEETLETLKVTVTGTPNQSATIEALQSQIAAQEAKNAEQDSLIDQIWHYIFG